jgi:hypothetical protein
LNKKHLDRFNDYNSSSKIGSRHEAPPTLQPDHYQSDLQRYEEWKKNNGHRHHTEMVQYNQMGNTPMGGRRGNSLDGITGPMNGDQIIQEHYRNDFEMNRNRQDQRQMMEANHLEGNQA